MNVSKVNNDFWSFWFSNNHFNGSQFDSKIKFNFHWNSSRLVLKWVLTVLAKAGCVQFATSCFVSSSIRAWLTALLNADFMFNLTALSPTIDIASNVSTRGTISSRNLSGQTTELTKPRLTASVAVTVLPKSKISFIARCPAEANDCEAKQSGIWPSRA